MDRMRAWQGLAALEAVVHGTGEGARAESGAGWFAAISGVANAELNVGCATPQATAASAGEIARALGDLPAIVFTDSQAVAFRAELAAFGFEVADTVEPLMACDRAPAEVRAPYRIDVAHTSEERAYALDLVAEAHQIDRALLQQASGAAAESERVRIWLARDELDLPVSVVWIIRVGSILGVTEMMTPQRFQGRGAGRALLAAALARSWDDTITDALLLSTPAGRRLYQSLGFVAVDESLTCFRGSDEDVLAAIGQGGSS